MQGASAPAGGLGVAMAASEVLLGGKKTPVIKVCLNPKP